jgi:hypothetical protein
LDTSLLNFKYSCQSTFSEGNGVSDLTDATGKDLPESVTLRFDPLAMVHAKWPQENLYPVGLISSEAVQAGGFWKKEPELLESR